MSAYPVFWLLLAAVAGPLLSEIRFPGFRVPAVVIEVLLGIAIGPQVLGLVKFEGFVEAMFAFGMAATLFMAGMELDFEQIRGRPLSLATRGWMLSIVLGLAATGLFDLLPAAHLPLMITLALCTTGLGVLIPIFRDGGLLNTNLGRFVLAAGTLGEVGPIVAMSVLLSQQYSSSQEFGFLVVFLAVTGMAIAIGLGARPPLVLSLFDRTMHTSSQLPLRISLLLLAGLFVLAEVFGFESIFGAFAAGMIVGVATRGSAGEKMREKLDAVCFGWFYPFFFVGTGIKFNLDAFMNDFKVVALVPVFLTLFLFVRGAPVFLYRSELAKSEMLPFALSCAVPSLSIIVVITEIGLRTQAINSNIASAIVGAALLAVLLFPTAAGALLAKRR